MPLAVLGFLVAIAYAPIPSAVSTPRWLVVEVGSFLLLLSTPARAPHWLAIAFLAWCAATVAWSASPLDSVGAMIQLAALAAAFQVAAETDDLRPFWIAIAAGSAINAAIAVAQVAGLHVFDVGGNAAGQPIGLFGNKNFLANFGALALVGCLALRGPLAVALAVGAATAALLPLCRGAMLALLVAGLVAKRASLAAWLLCAGAAVGAVAVDLWVHPLRLFLSVTPRAVTWEWTVTNLKPFGWGIGTYGTIFPVEHAFNDLLEFVFEVGAGTVLLLVLLARCFAVPGRAAEKAVLAAILVEGMFAFPLHQAATAFVAAVCAGHLSGSRARVRDAERGGGDRSVWGLLNAGPFGVRAI
jgi:hypothetical protein